MAVDPAVTAVLWRAIPGAPPSVTRPMIHSR